MHAEFDPFGALILLAWLAAGGYAVFTSYGQPRPTFRHRVLLIAGVAMLAIGGVFAVLALYVLWTMRN